MINKIPAKLDIIFWNLVVCLRISETLEKNKAKMIRGVEIPIENINKRNTPSKTEAVDTVVIVNIPARIGPIQGDQALAKITPKINEVYRESNLINFGSLKLNLYLFRKLGNLINLNITKPISIKKIPPNLRIASLNMLENICPVERKPKTATVMYPKNIKTEENPKQKRIVLNKTSLLFTL